jgi:hypothetical protein
MYNSKEDRARFAAAVGKVSLLTTKVEKPDEAVLRIYFEALKDFNVETIEEIADTIVRTEENLIALPSPGRWRRIGEQLFELRPTRTTPPPAGAPKCDECQDTGWRIRWEDNGHGWSERAVRCQHDGTDESDPPAEYLGRTPTLQSLDEEIPPVAGESDLARHRREWGNRIFHCNCCGYPYRQRAGWKCCGAPQGMTYQKWRALWHENCEGDKKNHCPRHCPHPRSPEGGGLIAKEQLPQQGETMHDWAVRMGFRNEEAPHD